jgi:hypothetical protein
MKIHGIKLNKKNFWIPFLISSVLSFLILFFVLSLWFDAFSMGAIDYILWIISARFFIFFILFILASIPTFFIIKRLLSKTPKKVFYFELPILIIIYSLLNFISTFAGLMMGAPKGMTILQILTLIIPQIIFVIVWISLLAISLYFHYKKFVLLNSK